MEGEPEPEATLFPATVGEKLRAAREAQGVDLAEVAANTRIPQRHLEAIEKSNYASLPSSTYALGFAKAYARAVGADEVAIARELRGELGGTYDRAPPPPSYEFEENDRGAPNGLIWASVVVAVLALIGVGLFYGTSLFRGSPAAPETLEIPAESNSSADGNEAIAAPVGGGQVALIAIDTVWLSVTDGTGKVLYQKQMAPGERYDVPADADHPRARTARPDLIQVTLNGSNVAPLAQGAQTVDVEVSADALRTRGQPGATPSPTASGTPAAAAPRPIATRPAPTPTPRPRPTAATAAPTPAQPVLSTAGNATTTP
jgi:transcriptional regulator with XRE-family HTH domain